MKVQLKSPVFEVTKEQMEMKESGDCNIDFDCECCPFNINDICWRHEMLAMGYTIEEVE